MSHRYLPGQPTAVYPPPYPPPAAWPTPPAARPRPRRWPWLVAGTMALLFAVAVLTPSTSQTTPSAPAAAAAVPARPVTDRELRLIAKDPAGHAGERIIVHGEVTQLDAATGAAAALAMVSATDDPDGYTTLVWLQGTADQLRDLVADDTFTASVTVQRATTYRTAIGGERTVPTLVADTITPSAPPRR